MPEVTTETVAELWRLLAEATPQPPWATVVKGNTVESLAIPGVCSGMSPQKTNAALIVAAVNALPALLDALEAAEAELRECEDGAEHDDALVVAANARAEAAEQRAERAEAGAAMWQESCRVSQVTTQRAQVAAARLRQALEAYDPPMPPALEGESDDQYTNRLTGADGTNRVPYAEHRNRQCSIGYHDECSDPDGERCQCPCHQFEALRAAALADDVGAETLAEVTRLLSEATPGPWVYMGDAYAFEGAVVTSVDGTRICDTPPSDDRPADMALIVAAVNNLGALLSRVEQLERVAEAGRVFVKADAAELAAISEYETGEGDDLASLLAVASYTEQLADEALEALRDALRAAGYGGD